MQSRFGLIFVLVSLLILGILAGATIVAFNRQSEHQPYQFLYRAVDKLARMYVSATLDDYAGPPEEYFSSTFTGVVGTVIEIPRADMPGAGGGIAAVGDLAVVMTFRGRIYLVNDDGSFTESSISVPDHGLDAYRAAAQRPEYSGDDFSHDFSRLRYNEIEYVSNELGRFLFITYTRFDGDNDCYRLVVSKLGLGNRSLEEISAETSDWEDVFQTSPCLPLRAVLSSIQGEEAGGRIAFSADGLTAYLTVGEYGWNGWDTDGLTELSESSLAQNSDTDYGKVIQIDLRTDIARHYSIGHRNSQGITVDQEGRVWAVEHGARGGDELNLITEGTNYGWPIVSYGTEYDGAPIPGIEFLGRHDGYQEPAYAWLPSIGVSSLVTFNGFHSTWEGDLGAISLRTGTLFRIRVEGERVIFTEEIEFGRRLRDIEQMDNGGLIVWTDSHEVIFLDAVTGSFGDQMLTRMLADLERNDPEFAAKAAEAFQSCSSCHAYNRDENRIGPALATVFGRRVGRHPTYGQYSNALQSANGIWDGETLAGYLRAPDRAYPGTTMPDPGIDDERVIQQVVLFLEQMKQNTVE